MELYRRLADNIVSRMAENTEKSYLEVLDGRVYRMHLGDPQEVMSLVQDDDTLYGIFLGELFDRLALDFNLSDGILYMARARFVDQDIPKFACYSEYKRDLGEILKALFGDLLLSFKESPDWYEADVMGFIESFIGAIVR